jgi:hypothetical protein
MEEQTYRSRLNNSYYKMSKSHLVVRGDVSEGSLKFFEERLNEALPTNDNERAQVRVIKDLFHNAPQLTYRVINAERDGMRKQALYVLWTNAWCITRHFEVDKLIRLEWDQPNNVYHVHALDQDEVPEPSQASQDERPPKKQAPRQQRPRQDDSARPQRSYQDDGDWTKVDKKNYRAKKNPYKAERQNRAERQNKTKPKTVKTIPEVPEPAPEPDPKPHQPIDDMIADIKKANDNHISWADE